MTEATLPQKYCGIDFRMNMDTDDIFITPKDDFSTISYYENLTQAVINRLRTRQGELSLHPNYGSLLHNLLGQKGNSLVLSEAQQYTREALLQEPRIKTISSIKASFKEGSNKQEIVIEIKIVPIGEQVDALNIVWDFFL